MTSLSNISQTPAQQAAEQRPPGSANVPRNVSFARDSNESNAYREHNPPTVLRRQEAARRDMSPAADGAQGSSVIAGHLERVNFQLDPDGPESADWLSQRSRNASSANMRSSGALSNLDQRSRNSSDLSAFAPNMNSLKWGSQPPRFSTPDVPMQRKVSGGRSDLFPLQTSSLFNPNQNVPLSAGSEKVEPNKQNEVHILVAVTGSVATIKLPLIVRKLKQIYRKSALIQVVVTRAATTFFDPSDLPRDIKVWHDSDEWISRQAPSLGAESGAHSDKQLHIQLRRWADILLVAPCSANTLAKFTYGICDNLLTSIFRVWNPEVPIILAPAMNTHMYTNPVTKLHFNVLKEFYPFVEILKPVEKVLVCGDIGMGGMREWTDIVQILTKRIGVALEEEDEEDSEDDSKADSRASRN